MLCNKLKFCSLYEIKFCLYIDWKETKRWVFRPTFKKVIQFRANWSIRVVILICLILGFVTHGFFFTLQFRIHFFNYCIASSLDYRSCLCCQLGILNLALGPMGALGGVCTGVLMQIYGCSSFDRYPSGISIGNLAGAFQGYYDRKTGI